MADEPLDPEAMLAAPDFWTAMGYKAPPEQGRGTMRRRMRDILAGLPPAQLAALEWRAKWRAQARRAQFSPRLLPDGRHPMVWLLKPGRGWGKTRTGAEHVGWQMWKYPGLIVGAVGATNDDTRKISFEGIAGLITVIPPLLVDQWNRSEMILKLINGSVCYGYSGEKPKRLRGPQHHLVWAEEVAAWADPDGMWDMISFGLRLKYRGSDGQPKGPFPYSVVTSTPRPIPLITGWLKDPDVSVVDGTTYENAENLDPRQLKKLKEKYEGTRLGRQELGGEVLEDNPGALWTYKLFDRQRRLEPPPPLARIVVAIDPAVTDPTKPEYMRLRAEGRGLDVAETGLIVAGRDGRSPLPHGYLLHDATGHMSPEQWASKAVALYREYRADCIVGEVNNGGDLIEAQIRAVDPNIPYRSVRASRGKLVRAEPVAMLYEQGRVWHCGAFPQYEDQCTSYTPGMKSPDRMDAGVWAFTELLLPDDQPYVSAPAPRGSVMASSSY